MSADREIRLRRRIAAPRTRVFDAFTDPLQVAAWWGPAGFRNTVHAMDVRPGGHWRYTMHGPDGKDWPNRIDYLAVEPPARLHYLHADDPPGEQPAFEVEIVFSEDAGATLVEMVLQFPDRAARDRVLESGAAEGGRQTLDRLETHLAQALVITRHFAAPPARVWRMLSEPALLARWWGPAGLALAIESLEFRPGGHFHYRMGDGAAAQWGIFHYREIEAPRRMVFTNGFCDADRAPVPAPFDPQWPLQILNTWTLTAQDGGTLLRLHGVPVDADAAGLATFRQHFESMRAGFGATFDQLQAELAKETHA